MQLRRTKIMLDVQLVRQGTVILADEQLQSFVPVEQSLGT
jgi:hypothetical protein